MMTELRGTHTHTHTSRDGGSRVLSDLKTPALLIPETGSCKTKGSLYTLRDSSGFINHGVWGGGSPWPSEEVPGRG